MATRYQLRFARLLPLGLLWLCLPSMVSADDSYFTIRNADTQLVEGVYLLDATIDFRFSDAAMEALLNGIPLVLDIEIRVERGRKWLWNDTVAALSQRYRLQFHALSDRYVIHNLNTDQRQSFTQLEDALYVLGVIREFPMLDRRLLTAGADYQAGIRASLVVEELPTPMRLWAYVSDQWHMNSPWYTWRLLP
jgi:hypothetical protein